MLIFVLKDCYEGHFLGSDKKLLDLYLNLNEGLFLTLNYIS